MPVRKTQSFRVRGSASMGSSEERLARFMDDLLDELTGGIEQRLQEEAPDRFDPPRKGSVRDSG